MILILTNNDGTIHSIFTDERDAASEIMIVHHNGNYREEVNRVVLPPRLSNDWRAIAKHAPVKHNLVRD